MNTSPVLKLLPFIILAVVISGGILMFQQRAAMQARLKELVERAQKEATTKLPEPTPFIAVKTRTDTIPTITPITSVTPSVASPTVAVAKGDSTSTKEASGTKSDKNSAGVTVITKNTVCTPVYGMANSCAEHTVVDTSVDTSVFYNLAGFSYLGGLLAFIKSKRSA